MTRNSFRGGKTNRGVSEKRPRVKREGKTVAAMISLYCSAEHEGKGLCHDCVELRDYALGRLDACPFQEDKTTCNKCPVHCFKPAMREKIKAVMRYAGPRMAYRHPIMTVFHFIDGRRKEPVKPGKITG